MERALGWLALATAGKTSISFGTASFLTERAGYISVRATNLHHGLNALSKHFSSSVCSNDILVQPLVETAAPSSSWVCSIQANFIDFHIDIHLYITIQKTAEAMASITISSLLSVMSAFIFNRKRNGKSNAS